jgi:hypothetical protein
LLQQPVNSTISSPQAKTPPDARILKIREYEDRLAKIQNAVKVCSLIAIS